MNCITPAAKPLVGRGSRWIELADIPWGAPANLAEFEAASKTLTSLELDRQIHAIHRGAGLNWRYMVAQLEDSLTQPVNFEFERLSGETWRGELQRSVLLVEYKDGLSFDDADFQDLYPIGSPHRQSLGHLDSYGSSISQIFGQILNGAMPRIMYSAYSGSVVPRLDILEPKLAEFPQDPALASVLIELASRLLEGSVSPAGSHLTLLPKTVTIERYI